MVHYRPLKWSAAAAVEGLGSGFSETVEGTREDAEAWRALAQSVLIIASDETPEPEKFKLPVLGWLHGLLKTGTFLKVLGCLHSYSNHADARC